MESEFSRTFFFEMGKFQWTLLVNSLGHFCPCLFSANAVPCQIRGCGGEAPARISKHCSVSGSGQVRFWLSQVSFCLGLGQFRLGQVWVGLGLGQFRLGLGWVRFYVRFELGQIWVRFWVRLGWDRFWSGYCFSLLLKRVSMKIHPKNVHENLPKKTNSW